MIDLRSDTVTQPTDRRCGRRWLAAEVGDDVYGEDPTVDALERRVPSCSGTRPGCSAPPGRWPTCSASGCWSSRARRCVCDVQAHIARAEMGAHAAVHGLTMRTFPSVPRPVDVDEVAEIIAPNAGPYLVSTAAVAVENTHNFGGGTIQPLEHLRAVGDAVSGARPRLPPGRRPAVERARRHRGRADRLRALFDTVSVCFSKGLGAPVGSVLVSTARERSPGPGCCASGSAAAGGRPASWPPAAALRA